MKSTETCFVFLLICALAHLILNGGNPILCSQNNYDKASDVSQLIVQGMYWSNLAESYTPKGLSFNKCVRRSMLLQGQVAKLFTKSAKGVCGRMPNAVIKLEDGTVMCAKYRGNYSAYGEVLTFYLSLLLSMDNVPVVILVTTNRTSAFWKEVNISSLSWEENQLVALIEWIDYSSSKTRLPPIIYDAFIKGEPITSRTISNSDLLNRTPGGIAEVVQWGTMILLDYLIGHLDRYIHFHIADAKSNHPSISLNITRNVIHSHDGKIWLIDNEMTFYLSYFGKKCQNVNCLTNQLTFYEDLLKTMCVFQLSVVSALRNLLSKGSIYDTLLSLTKSFQFLESKLEIDKEYRSIADILEDRAFKVLHWIQQYCWNICFPEVSLNQLNECTSVNDRSLRLGLKPYRMISFLYSCSIEPIFCK